MFRLAILVLALSALPAAAHPGHDAADAIAGFVHPFTGIDHVAAMVVIGAWAALLGGPRYFVWPLAFIGAMIGGAGLAHIGVALPYVEQGIAASLVVAGLLLALAIEIPTLAGAALAAAFALFHGYAHGLEASGGAFVPFIAGFAGATAVLHLLGIGVALGLMAAFNAMAVRLFGGATAAAGAVLLLQGSA